MDYLSADDLIEEIEIVEIVYDDGETVTEFQLEEPFEDATEFQPNESVEDLPEILPNESVKDELLLEEAVEITKRKSSSVDESTPKKSKIIHSLSSELQEGLPPVTTIYNLPVEILLAIFDFLPLKDRKNMRLTCELLCGICSRYELQEKICINLLHDSFLHPGIFEMLTKSKRQGFHLEFYGSSLMSLVGSVFSSETCMERMLTLKLSSCKLSKSVLLNILQYCTSLKSLELRFDSIYHDVELALSGLCCDDIRNQSIKELKIMVAADYSIQNSRYLLLRYVSQILHSCPNIVKFSLCHQSIVEKSWLLSSIDDFACVPHHKLLNLAQKTDILSSFYQLLANSQMENIEENYWIHSGWEWNTRTSFEGLENITEITVDMVIAKEESFKKFLLVQVHLKSITCVYFQDLGDLGHQHSQALLNEMVEAVLQVPSLHAFQLISRQIIVWKSDWFTRLSASNINTLRLGCREIKFSSCTFPSNPKMIHFALLVASEHNFSHIESLLETFPNLEELYLSHINSSLLAAICSKKIKLQSLHANSLCDPMTSVHLIQLLKFLRRLEMPLIIPPSSFNRLQFLKHLHIKSSLQSPNFDLKYLAQYWSPMLETVRIDSKGKTRAKAKFIKCVDQFAAKLENLKFLSFSFLVKMNDLTVSDVSKIFDHCPTLQILVVHEVAFYKNVFSQGISKVQKQIPRDQKFDTYELVAKYMDSEKDGHPWDYFFNRSDVPTSYF